MNPITNFEKWINSIATGTAPDIPPVTRFEHFLNKIRLAIARKSDITSGLPDYTAEDNGKVLTVEKEQSGTATVTVISTQQVTFVGVLETTGQLAKGTLNTQTLEDGDTVTVNVGEGSYTCKYSQRDNLIASKNVEIDSEGNITLFMPTAGTYTVNAYATTIAYKAEAKWSKSVDIPEPTAADDGKFLGANHKTIVWSEVPNTLPSYSSSDNGKVLGIYTDRQTGKTTPIWVVRQIVPNSSSSDAGKILAVNTTGGLAWENRHSDEFLITITLPPTSGMPYTCDKTAKQIKDAFNAGKIITGRTVFEGTYHTGLVTLYHGNSGLYSLTLLTTNGNAISAYHYDLATDTITYKSVSLS